MRALLNLPLALALLLGWWAFQQTVFAVPPIEGQRSMGEGIEIVLAMFVAWLLLAVVLAACAGMGGLTWLPIRGGGAIALVLFIYLAIVMLALVPIGITLEDHADIKWGIDQVGAARLASFGLPLALALYAGWMVNGGTYPGMHYAALGAIGALSVVSSVVTFREMARWDQVAQAGVVAERQAAADRVQENRRAFAALTDADPLPIWDSYVGNAQPDDIRTEALRRIARRPNLEAELTEGLACDNPNWIRELLSLIARLDIAPSAALDKPVRAAFAMLTDELRHGTTIPAEREQPIVDYDYPPTLQALSAVAERLADTSGMDLRDALDDLQQAIALYPNSAAARDFPAQAAAARTRIAETLARRAAAPL